MTSDGQKTSRYKRILLKLSGEALKDTESGQSIAPAVLSRIARQVKAVTDMGVEVSVVVGGGNIFRGLAGQEGGIERTAGDYMGMLATIINGLAIQNAFERNGIPTRLQTAIEMDRVAEPFIVKRAIRHMEKGRVVIFAGGTGNPFFSTDTAAALRASEIRADVLLKATKVDGVYSADPMKDPNATRYERLDYIEALHKSLKVMDAAAFSLCMENEIPIIVFDFFKEGSIESVVAGEAVGTLVSSRAREANDGHC